MSTPTELCPAYAPFFGYAGATFAMALSGIFSIDRKLLVHLMERLNQDWQLPELEALNLN